MIGKNLNLHSTRLLTIILDVILHLDSQFYHQRHVHDSSLFLIDFFSLPLRISDMMRIHDFDVHASGLFALDKTIKVNRGSVCRLERNALNLHG